MTTLQSYKKFGLEMRGAVGAILTIAGCALALLGLAVVIVDRATGKFVSVTARLSTSILPG